MTLTPNAYQKIIASAWGYLLKGGGLVPGDGDTGIEDTITAVAAAHFGGTAAGAAFDATIKGLDYDQHEAIYVAAWELVNAHQDAAFVFGAAVGRQLGTVPDTAAGAPATPGKRGRR